MENQLPVKKKYYPKLIAKLLGASVLVLLAAVLTGTWILVTFYADEIKAEIARRINNYLEVPVDVREIDFTVWKTFPLASVDFKGVVIYDAISKNKQQTFLIAEHVYFSLNILDIINKSYKIRAFSLHDAKINLRFNNLGEGNYKFWKDLNGLEDTGAFNLHLKNIKAENVEFNFDYPSIEQSYRIYFKTLNLNGIFAEKDYSLNANTNAFIEYLKIAGINYINKKHAKLYLKLEVTDNKLFAIKQGNLLLEQVPLSLLGTINNGLHLTELDLVIKENNATITQLLSVLPEVYRNKLGSYKGNGKLKLEVKVKGFAGSQAVPSVNSNFELHNGELLVENIALTDINLKGFFTNGQERCNKSSAVQFSEINLLVNKQPLSGSIEIKNFDVPTASGELKGKVDLAAFDNFIKLDTIQSMEGQAAFDIEFSWPLHGAQEKQRLVNEYKTEGSLELSDVAISLKQRVASLSNFSGNMAFNNQDIKINSLKGNINKSDVALTGYFQNIIPYLTGLSNKLTIDANLKSNELALDELLAFTSQRKQSKEFFRLILPADLNFNIKAEVNKILFKNFVAEQVSGYLRLRDRKLTTQNLSFNSFDGLVQLNGLMDGTDTTTLQIICHSNTSKLNINKLFSQLENFGQTYLTDKNLKGNLSAQTDLSFKMTNGLQINTPSVIMTSDVLVENGELNNYEALLSLSRFIEVNELKQVKFATLKNRIEIKNRTVYIPAMEIKSNALNLSVAGTHTFDQYLDYYFKIGLRDLLAAKARKKKENSEFGEYVERDKQINIFLHVNGHIDNLKFTYDRKGFKEHLKQEIANERNTVKALLKQEFGLFKNDTNVKLSNKTFNSPPVEIEWSENNSNAGSDKENKNLKKKFEENPKPSENKVEPKNKILRKLLKENNKTERAEDIN